MRRGTFIDDPLFPDGGDPAAGGGPGGKGEPDPKANGGDPDPKVGISMADVAEVVTQAQAPLIEQMTALGDATAKLAQNASNPQHQTQTGAAEPDADFLTLLGTDPEKAIGGLLDQKLGTLAPLIGNLMNSGTSAFVGLEAQQVDAEFGAGAWAKLFDKPMQTIVDSYRTNNAAALADHNTVTREVNMLKGQLVDQLIEFRDTSRKTATEAETARNKTLTDGIVEDVTQRTNMTGGIRRQESGAIEITENIKGYVEERQRAIGGKESGKDFMERTDYGNSIEDFQEHQKKLKAAQGGTQ